MRHGARPPGWAPPLRRARNLASARKGTSGFVGPVPDSGRRPPPPTQPQQRAAGTPSRRSMTASDEWARSSVGRGWAWGCAAVDASAGHRARTAAETMRTGWSGQARLQGETSWRQSGCTARRQAANGRQVGCRMAVGNGSERASGRQAAPDTVTAAIFSCRAPPAHPLM